MRSQLPSSVTRAADPIALRRELELKDPVDIGSPDFERFVIRLSERLDIDIPREHYPQLATLNGCSEYVGRVRSLPRQL
ncbi:MAG: hypothetical protein AB1938_23610 [Myxococcota bacterium]